MIATLHFLYMKENGTVVGTEMALVTFCCLPPYLTISTPIGSAWGPLVWEKDGVMKICHAERPRSSDEPRYLRHCDLRLLLYGRFAPS
jgi:hypothetical protein